jgi:hypothetical protein
MTWALVVLLVAATGSAVQESRDKWRVELSLTL